MIRLNLSLRTDPQCGVRVIRNAHGLSQASLSGLLKMDRHSLSRWEKGQSVTYQKVMALFQVLGIDAKGPGLEQLAQALVAGKNVRVVGLSLEVDDASA